LILITNRYSAIVTRGFQYTIDKTVDTDLSSLYQRQHYSSSTCNTKPRDAIVQ